MIKLKKGLGQTQTSFNINGCPKEADMSGGGAWGFAD